MALLPSPLPLHSLTYSPVARRLITEQQFWAHAALAELVKSGAVPGRCSSAIAVCVCMYAAVVLCWFQFGR